MKLESDDKTIYELQGLKKRSLFFLILFLILFVFIGPLLQTSFLKHITPTITDSIAQYKKIVVITPSEIKLKYLLLKESNGVLKITYLFGRVLYFWLSSICLLLMAFNLVLWFLSKRFLKKLQS
jgi:hypothetical protein